MFLVIGMMLFLAISMISTVHALGLWLVLLVTHGIFVLVLGDSVIHLPLYSGVVVALIIVARRQWSGVDNHILYLFAGLAVIMMLASVQGINHDHSIAALRMYGKAFLLALLVAGCVKNEKDMQAMMLYCLLGLVLGALYTLYQSMTGNFVINEMNSQRAAGLRGDPNETAMLLVAGVPLAIYWFINTKKIYLKILFAACLPLLLIGIGLTQSRGGFVALLFIAFLIYLRRPTIQLSIAGLIMVLVVAVLAPASYWQRMNTLVEGESGVSMGGRSFLLKVGLNMMVNYPVLGVGPGNFGNAPELNTKNMALAGASSPHSGVEKGKKAVAHNMYLEFFTENGLIGGIILLIIFYIPVRRLLEYDRFTRIAGNNFGMGYSITLAMAGMFLAGLFLSQGKNSVLWFMIGLGLAAGQLLINHRNKPETKDEINDSQSPEVIDRCTVKLRQ